MVTRLFGFFNGFVEFMVGICWVLFCLFIYFLIWVFGSSEILVGSG